MYKEENRHPAPWGFDFFVKINYINTMNKNAV
jgi:hypothetical protein